jgi:hypothetical protein
MIFTDGPVGIRKKNTFDVWRKGKKGTDLMLTLSISRLLVAETAGVAEMHWIHSIRIVVFLHIVARAGPKTR